MVRGLGETPHQLGTHVRGKQVQDNFQRQLRRFEQAAMLHEEAEGANLVPQSDVSPCSLRCSANSVRKRIGCD
jgi:hypothetical protein